MNINIIHNIEALKGLKELPDESCNCCITSPPYYKLRNYSCKNQIGLENTPQEYIKKLVAVFSEVKRVLKKDGTLWINIADTYCSNNTLRHNNDTPKVKDLIGIPWLLAFALRSDGWYLRQDIIWSKPNPMPESVRDRCTKSHEYIFLLTKSPKYYYDLKAIAVPSYWATKDKRFLKGPSQSLKATQSEYKCKRQGVYSADGMRNKFSVWHTPTRPFKGAHFAAYPPDLITDCIKAGCPENGIVLDPFMGSGTTALTARKLRRNYIGFELNPEYVKLADERIRNELGLFSSI